MHGVVYTGDDGQKTFTSFTKTDSIQADHLAGRYRSNTRYGAALYGVYVA